MNELINGYDELQIEQPTAEREKDPSWQTMLLDGVSQWLSEMVAQ